LELEKYFNVLARKRPAKVFHYREKVNNFMAGFLLTVVCLATVPPVCALPAFPGAEGMGATTTGGRGGAIYFVTNLNDAGPGSLRNAVEAPARNYANGYYQWESTSAFAARLESAGHRIVVFRVSGFIHHLSTLEINIPYLTIAGQTSPGGIALSGGMVRVRTHDVIVTHLRIRSGSDVCDPENLNNTDKCDTEGDSLNIGGIDGVSAYNVIFDHCSFAWGNDETVQFGGWYGDTYDVTMSWCLVAEGLDDPAPENEHGLGVMTFGKYSVSRPVSVSIHHNFMGSFRYRMPEIGGNCIADVRNNVVYGWENSINMSMDYIADQTPSIVNFVHNYTKPGPISNPCGTLCSEVFFCDTTDPINKCHAQAANAYEALYVYGNLGCARTSQSDEHWKVVCGWSPFEWLPTQWRSMAPFEMPGIPVTTTEMSATYVDTILLSVGATKPVRDSLDTRFISEYYAGTGGTKPDMHWADYPVGWPVFADPPVPADTDNDGMADNWETDSGLNATLDDSAADADNDGYTNIEEYLHVLGGYAANTNATPPAPPSGINVK